jgi:uncharacterized membrane protein YbaN (DUF454 family)
VRYAYLVVGIAAVLLGAVGAFLPLLPTVPFLILAAFCFARSNPVWERRLLEHPRFGPHISAWRKRGAISLRAKLLALGMLGASAASGLVLLAAPWCYVPVGVAVVTGSWLWTRPSA